MNNIFCIWSGSNEMSAARKKCLESLRRHCNCNLILINPLNLKQYEVDEHPFHKGLKYLSLTHQADFLRMYLMYHHGGGYTDIKNNTFDWRVYFDILYQSDKQFIGYAERHPTHIAFNNEKARNAFRQLAGNGHYIFKKKSQIAKLHLAFVENLLDTKLEQLKNNPGDYHPRAIKGGVQGESLFKDKNYPFEWNEILGRVFHSICFDNLNQFILKMPYPSFSSYR